MERWAPVRRYDGRPSSLARRPYAAMQRVRPQPCGRMSAATSANTTYQLTGVPRAGAKHCSRDVRVERRVRPNGEAAVDAEVHVRRYPRRKSESTLDQQCCTTRTKTRFFAQLLM